MQSAAPSNPADRFAVYRFFNGISAEADEGLGQPYTRVPLVKTFLLEHVSGHGGKNKSPNDIWRRLNADLRNIDDKFMSVTATVVDPDKKLPRREVTGFLEQYDERFFAYYTHEGSQEAKKRVARWVQSPDLDFAWFSSPLLQTLWDKDISGRGDHRFGKLVFRHESIFEMPEDFASADDADDSTEQPAEAEENDSTNHPEPERRKARFVMGDRIGRIRASLNKLQANYDPLNALYAVRMASRTGRGGHELYQAGRITNRSDSFEDHRNTVRYLYRIYKSILDFTEQIAWSENTDQISGRRSSKGVPLIVRFDEPLQKSTFDRWVQMAFQKRNRFKLWGDPIRLGPTKVHVYGADRHLWQPINLEMTASSVVAILPQETCGNTFHRLVANIQQYVSPKIKAWIGSEPFEDVVSKWPAHWEGSDGD